MYPPKRLWQGSGRRDPIPALSPTRSRRRRTRQPPSTRAHVAMEARDAAVAALAGLLDFCASESGPRRDAAGAGFTPLVVDGARACCSGSVAGTLPSLAAAHALAGQPEPIVDIRILYGHEEAPAGYAKVRARRRGHVRNISGTPGCCSALAARLAPWRWLKLVCIEVECCCPRVSAALSAHRPLTRALRRPALLALLAIASGGERPR